MKFPGLRSAILVVGAGVLITIPTALVIGSKPVRSAAVPRPSAAGQSWDYDDHKAQIASRVAPATPPPTPTEAEVNARAATHAAPPPPVPPPSVVPSFSHVFLIVMENHEYGSVIGSSAAPYLNSLAGSYGLATNYYAASHPSLPNYLALTAGSRLGSPATVRPAT